MGDQFSSEEVMDLPMLSENELKGLKKRPRHKFWLFRWGLFIYDFLAIYAAFWSAAWIMGVPFDGVTAWIDGLWPVVFVLLIQSFFPSGNLYSYHLIFSRKRHFVALSKAMGWGGLGCLFVAGQYMLPYLWNAHPTRALILGCLGLGAFIWFYIASKDSTHNLLRALGISFIAIWVIHQLYHGRIVFMIPGLWVIPVGFLLSFGLLMAGRHVIIEDVYHGWLMRHFRRQVGIVGTNAEAEKIASHIIDNNAPFWIAGTIGSHSGLNTTIPKDCLGDIVELPAIAADNRLSDIIVTDETLSKKTLISLLDFALNKGIAVWFPANVLPIIDKKIYIDQFCGLPMIRMCQQKRVVYYNRLKYALDAIIALPLLVVLVPLLGFIAAAIKLNSKGPVFYMADAVGRDGRPFKMFKYRSMRVNNDNDIHKQFVTKLIKGEIGNDPDDDKPLKITDDPRVTFVGKYLRKFSLDELPQIFNVLLGQMSLIGPRPCLTYEFDVYEDWYKRRASIRPGITGLWQVTGRSEVAFEDMILLDLYYVYNRNIWLDINILIETVFVVLKKKGAY